MASNADRRRLLRINLDSPIEAMVESSKVILRDISATGARIEHKFPLSRGREITLELKAGSEQVTITCKVLRCKLEKHSAGVSYYSGLRYNESGDDVIGALRDIIAHAVSRDFEARKQHLSKIRK